MIEPKELRIGNILKDGARVIALSDDNIRIVEKSGFEYDSICNMPAHGEPLTSEWLERFGFEKHEDLPPSYKIPNIDGWPIFVEGVLIDYVDGKIQSQAMCFSVQVQMEYEIAKIKYVHQLQNLYFALTGQELELK